MCVERISATSIDARVRERTSVAGNPRCFDEKYVPGSMPERHCQPLTAQLPYCQSVEMVRRSAEHAREISYSRPGMCCRF